MAYLLAKIAFLLLVAASLGGLIVYWWVRRRYEDVSVRYAELARQAARAAQLEKENSRLGEGLAALQTVKEQLAGLNRTEAELSADLTRTWRTSVEQLRQELNAELTRISRALINLKASSNPGARFKRLEEQMESLRASWEHQSAGLAQQNSLMQLRAEIPAPPEPLDHQPVLDAVRALRASLVESLRHQPVLDAVQALRAALPQPIDRELAALKHQLEETRQTANRLELRESSDAAERQLSSEISELAHRVGELQVRAADLVTQESLNHRFDALEQLMAPRDEPSANLLESAEHGEPDDLKQISGIGPKLERLLHGVGVYYFWQVADWQPEDVAVVDTRLQAFRGRIERDGWVPQAIELAKSSPRRRPERSSDVFEMVG